jgi:Ca2+-binding EF-hand superfamily protein
MDKNQRVFCILLLLSIAALFGIAESKKLPTDILATSCLNGYAKTRWEHEQDVISWKTCRFQREEVISWVGLGFDRNNDSSIDMDECNFARNFYFTPKEQEAGESCYTVFERCDCDNDGFITEEDFALSAYTCLRDCGAAMRIWFFIGSRMPKKKAFAGLQEADQTIDKDVLNQ